MGLAERSAAAAITALVLMVTLLVMYAPKLRLGGDVTVLHGRTVQSDPDMVARVAALEAENERLKEAMKAALMTAVRSEKAEALARREGAAVAAVARGDPTVVKVDMLQFLGVNQYLTGVSYDPFVCFPPLELPFPKSEDQIVEVEKRIVNDLREELAKIHGAPLEAIDGNRMYQEQEFAQGKFPVPADEAIRPLVMDDKFLLWRDAISRVAARYLCDAQGHLHMNCQGVPDKEDLATLGQHCRSVTTDEALARFGFYTTPWLQPALIAHTFVKGTCFTHVRNKTRSFAHWITEERMTEEWRTFPVETPEQDKVLLLFDMLYEKLLVFTKQYWMGVITMQNPFDMYSIQDIIYTTKPDLLIETGTANGGSAVLWSGIMELVGLESSKIVTIDVTEPSWDPGAQWGGAAVAREDPTKNKMWQKRVTFIKGYTTDPKVIQQVRKAAEGLKSVLVTLDSGHDQHNVAAEMEAYCPLVTVGSYCVVEDTKMSRWHSTGPLAAVKEFLSRHPEFAMDRTRELLYTHHAMGYIKRIK